LIERVYFSVKESRQMEYKQCSKCKEFKPLSDYYKDSRKDGKYYPHCKTCHKVYIVNWQHTEKGKDYRRRYRRSESGKKSDQQYQHGSKGKATAQRFRDSKKGQEYRKEYFSKPEVKRKVRERAYERISKEPHKHQARVAVSNAIKTGIMSPVQDCKCIDCGKTAQEYHHHQGYEKEQWLNVVPLCRNCHKRRHNKDQ